jgi:muramoyltetrapeptide carboxypeptidase
LNFCLERQVFDMKELPLRLLKPARLAAGQTLGVVAPAAPLEEPELIQASLETVASLGFKVKPGARLFDHHGYFAGVDEARAADLNAMFADPEISGIITLRGGYGASRLLPFLDYELIQHNPKVLVGYSDITALLNGIHACTGLVTFHGPVADQAFTPYTLAEFKKVLFEGRGRCWLGAAPPFSNGEGLVERHNRVVTLQPGIARGRLFGGNLSLVSHLVGTPYLPDLAGAILFLEDVNEAVYRLDRMLVQLRLSGILEKVSGLVFGKFTACLPSAGAAWQFTLFEVLLEFSLQVGVPAVSGLMIGHLPDQATLPLGCLAELDADAGTLKLLEAGVV